MPADQRMMHRRQSGVVLAGVLEVRIVAEYLIVAVQDAHSPDALSHLVRERLVDRVHVGEQGVAALRRHLDPVQDRAHTRHFAEGAIGMP